MYMSVFTHMEYDLLNGKMKQKIHPPQMGTSLSSKRWKHIVTGVWPDERACCP